MYQVCITCVISSCTGTPGTNRQAYEHEREPYTGLTWWPSCKANKWHRTQVPVRITAGWCAPDTFRRPSRRQPSRLPALIVPLVEDVKLCWLLPATEEQHQRTKPNLRLRPEGWEVELCAIIVSGCVMWCLVQRRRSGTASSQSTVSRERGLGCASIKLCTELVTTRYPAGMFIFSFKI